MSVEIDQQFVEYVVKSLVGNPDDVSIERTIDERGVLLELTVNPEDLGRVIGKRGSTAQSIRTLLRALGTKHDGRYNLKIVDNGEERPEPVRDDRASNVPAPSDNQTVSAADDSDDSSIDADEDSAINSVVEEVGRAEQFTPAAEAPVQAEAPIVQEEAPVELSMADKHRAELAELDDLDI